MCVWVVEVFGTFIVVLLQNVHECEYASFWCCVYQVIYFAQNSSMWYLSHFSCERVFQQLHQVPWICFPAVHFTLGCTIKEAEGFLHYVSDRKQNTLDLNDENHLQPVPHFTSWRVRTLDSSLADPKANQGSVSEKRRFKKNSEPHPQVWADLSFQLHNSWSGLVRHSPWHCLESKRWAHLNSFQLEILMWTNRVWYIFKGGKKGKHGFSRMGGRICTTENCCWGLVV